MEGSKERRALNWTEDEENAVSDAILPHYDTLFGAHSKDISQVKKRAIWTKVEATVKLKSIPNINS